MITGLLIITGIICIKYRPLYKITINGQTIGYVTNKDNFENRINDYINTQEEPSIAFKTLDVAKAYNLELVERAKIYNEDEVLNSVIDNTRIIYTMYAILIEDQITSYVETGEEAEKVVKELNDEYKGKKIKIGSIQIYSTSEPQLLETKVAVAQIEKNNIRPIVTARSKTTTRGTATTAKTTKAVKTITQETTYTKKQSGINGVIFSVQPVSGIITSKFGGKRGHTGLDIASK